MTRLIYFKNYSKLNVDKKNKKTANDLQTCSFAVPQPLVSLSDNLDFLLMTQIVTKHHMNSSSIKKKSTLLPETFPKRYILRCI